MTGRWPWRFDAGDLVWHPRYGEGTVTEVRPATVEDPADRATVAFRGNLTRAVPASELDPLGSTR